jgi:hypothetical protein
MTAFKFAAVNEGKNEAEGVFLLVILYKVTSGCHVLRISSKT